MFRAFFSACLFILIVNFQTANATWGEDELSRSVKIYTHGEGLYAMQQKDGSLKGAAMPLLACSFKKMGVEYSVSISSMARASRLARAGTLDIWFPTFNWQPLGGDRVIIGEIGKLSGKWITHKYAKLQPDDPSFKNKANIATFSGSGLARIAAAEGYKITNDTDDENRLMLWLFEGKIDAVLATDFRNILAPGMKQRVDEIAITDFREFSMGFEFAEQFDARYPDFKTRFKQALIGCK